MDFEIGGKPYCIEFTIGRILLYERAARMPLMATFVKNGGAFGIDELATLAGYGMKAEGGKFVKPDKGKEKAMRLIETNGYPAVFERVAEALQRDCGFLFETSEGTEPTQ